MELVDHCFQKALGYEVGLEGKTTSEDEDYFDGKVERLVSFLDPGHVCLQFTWRLLGVKVVEYR